MSTLLPLSIVILLATGWLTFLPSAFSVTKQKLYVCLTVISCISLLPPVTVTSSFDIKLDYFFMFLLFIYCLTRLPIHQVITLISLMLMLASILFLYHEVTKTALLWRSSGFQWFTILFSTAEAIVVSRFIMEQYCLVFGGLLALQCGLYYLYHERLSPIAFPGLGAMDTFWIVFVILMVVQGVYHWMPYVYRNWRVAYWIRKR